MHSRINHRMIFKQLSEADNCIICIYRDQWGVEVGERLDYYGGRVHVEVFSDQRDIVLVEKSEAPDLMFEDLPVSQNIEYLLKEGPVLQQVKHVWEVEAFCVLDEVFCSEEFEDLWSQILGQQVKEGLHRPIL